MKTARHPAAARLGRVGALGAGLVLLGNSAELVGMALAIGAVVTIVLMAVLALAGAFAKRKARRDSASRMLKLLLDFLRPRERGD